MKFKVGDKVKIREDFSRTKHYKVTPISNMEKYRGRIARVKRISSEGNYNLDIDGMSWYWSDDMLEPYKTKESNFNKSDLKDGDKCTLKNGQVVFVDKTSNYGFSSIDEQLRYFNDDVSIVKVERPAQYETVFERKEEILDETEKRYLASVIKPFKNKIETIEKTIKIGDSNLCYLNMLLKNNDMANLPNFKKTSMYKGMETNKKYTLKELGL